MTHPLASVVSALRSDQQQLRAIAQNVGGLGQAGFKRILDATAVEQGAAAVDLRDGPLVATGGVLDLALENNGFFALAEADGSEVLTRAGRFRLDPEGYVVDPTGRRLLTEEGALRLGSGQVEIDHQGRLRQNGAELGQLAIRWPLSTLERIDGDPVNFRSATSEPAEGYRVHQRHIESANVDGATEMVRMIELSRHVESVQRALSIYDRALDSGINRLGDA